MKGFNIAVIAFLAITAVAVFKMTKTEETYQQRIGNIAKEINAMNTTWKAHEPSRFINMNFAEVKRLMGSLPEEESNRNPSVSQFFDMTPINAPPSFDSRSNW